MNDFAIELSNVSKEFTPQQHVHTSLKSVLLNPLRLLRRTRSETFLALDDVSLRVERGETHGVIGGNGAGKSTLLAVIGGVLHSTRGTTRVSGRICPLLELGVGFVPDLSCEENAILNGVLLGMRRSTIKKRLDQVIAFAELQAFRNQELKTFSSGMQSRLGFSVAVHADPEVLLVDEVLAVGDASFQARCLDRIDELKKAGVTILLVSHDLATVARTCDRATWIDKGRAVVSGPPAEVVARYKAAVGASATKRQRPLPVSEDP